jgi:AcrR family transcriptional regulator
MIDLVFEGHAPPSTDEVAHRAGVSVASLFRYFESIDDLQKQATEHYFERFSHLFDIPDIGVGDLTERTKRFAGARVAQHETTAPVARLVRHRSFVFQEIDASLHRLRATQTDQLRLHFAEELEELTPTMRADLVATIATLTSFESWDQFANDHQRSAAQIRRAWTTTLLGVLG